MKFAPYLLLLALIIAGGCKSKPPQNAVTMSMHLPADVTTPQDRRVPAVIRSPTMSFLVDGLAVFTDDDLDGVELRDDDDGLRMRFAFNTAATIRLDVLSNDKRGSLVVVFLNNQPVGAPQLKQRIVDGTFEFTPNVSREEAERLVEGLNALIQYKKKR
jgi:preprotein translocase subunit SecD